MRSDLGSETDRHGAENDHQLMVDTGAHKTVVDRAIADGLGLRPTRFEQMVGVSHIPEDCPVYLMSVVIGVSDGIRDSMIAFTTEMIGMATPPTPRPFSGLLGRDFFRFVRIVYDGPAGCVDIHALPPPGKTGVPRGGKKGPARRQKSEKQARRRNRPR